MLGAEKVFNVCIVVKSRSFCRGICRVPVLGKRGVFIIAISLWKRCTVSAVRAKAALLRKVDGHLIVDLTGRRVVLFVEVASVVLFGLKGRRSPRIIVTVVVVVVVVTVELAIKVASVFSEVELVAMVPLVMLAVIPKS